MKKYSIILLFTMGVSCALSAPLWARSDLWVTGKKTNLKASIEIPSLSPLVKARESAVLVVFTESDAPAMMPLPFPFGALGMLGK